ncbi:MAG: hypothetical protein FJ033_16140 [Chloroflexi bacterium]|nr:hypothetical protein [Chloroflexota bacterium]
MFYGLLERVFIRMFFGLFVRLLLRMFVGLFVRLLCRVPIEGSATGWAHRDSKRPRWRGASPRSQ